MGVASKVFAEKGYYATTVADLASAAGIAKGTIYWYFNNKQAIMLAILDDIVSEINESFGLVVRDTPNGLEAILRCVEPSMKLLEKHGPIYLMYFLEIGSTDRVLQEKYRDIYRAVHAGTRMALERGMKEGLIRKVNPELAAYGVMGLIERISQVTGPGGSEIPVGLKIKEAKELLRHALVSKSAGSKGSQR
jgi:AcrR family transcriptional regulator